MRKINEIVVHCSDSKAGSDIGAEELRKWHTGPPPGGRGWRDVGYHFIIRRDGTLEAGRPLDRIGAHVVGHNSNSIGVCLVGGKGENGRPEANYTRAQWAALKDILAGLRRSFPGAEIKGHRDYPGVKKECPCFDVRAWLAREGKERR